MDSESHAAYATSGKLRVRDDTTQNAYSERELEVLAAPNLHRRVVRADVLEVLARNGEQAARHCGRVHRVDVALPAVRAARLVGLRHRPPRVLQVPVEAAHLSGARAVVVERERRVVDHVDHRCDHSRPVGGDGSDEWLEPTCTMSMSMYS